MERQFFPCLVHGPDEDGWYAVVVPGPNVNAQARSEAAALVEAAEILQELIDEAGPAEAIRPGDLEAYREPNDRSAIIQVSRAVVAA